ncbi:MAG: hypothetical protein F4Y61_07810, partial [Rhodothermaceae bacterium]|nr:hypothetical protein [Rhodothermaceae bacterium]
MRTAPVVIAVALLAGTVFLEAQPQKGEEYTVVIPRGVLELEGRDWSQTHSIYGASLHLSSARWERSLPYVDTLAFEKQSETDNGLTEYEFRRHGRWIKLRVPNEATLNRYVAEDDGQSLVEDALRQVGSNALADTRIPQDLWVEVARYVWQLGGQTLQPLVEFRGEEYLVADLGTWGNSFNSARLNQTQRVANVIGELMDTVK